MLSFPNRSRTYDATRTSIRFTGYDGMFEIPFLVEAAALSKTTRSRCDTEADSLKAFDAARDIINAVAQKAFSRGRKTMYVLTEADFR